MKLCGGIWVLGGDFVCFAGVLLLRKKSLRKSEEEQERTRIARIDTNFGLLSLRTHWTLKTFYHCSAVLEVLEVRRGKIIILNTNRTNGHELLFSYLYGLIGLKGFFTIALQSLKSAEKKGHHGTHGEYRKCKNNGKDEKWLSPLFWEKLIYHEHPYHTFEFTKFKFLHIKV